jgi:ferrous iron transport protein A
MSTPLVSAFTVSPAEPAQRAVDCLRRDDMASHPAAALPHTLDRAATGARHTVAAVIAPPHSSEWASRLEEIGFIAGEQVLVTARAPLGGDPLVVRVGQSTFALRRAEAACVLLNASP